MLIQWFIREYKVELPLAAGLRGAELAEAFADALGAAGFSFDEQQAILLEAPQHCIDLAFAEACTARVERIEALQRRRAEALQRFRVRCQDGVGRRGLRQPAAEVAVYRFVPLWGATDEHADIVDDMLRRLAAEGYFLATGDALRDLRQGLGYYRRGEDTLRLRHPVRWLGGLNALHWWINLMFADRCRLIGTATGRPKKWVTAASLFLDRDGHQVTYDRIEHGEVTPAEQQRLRALVPLMPNSLTLNDINP